MFIFIQEMVFDDNLTKYLTNRSIDSFDKFNRRLQITKQQINQGNVISLMTNITPSTITYETKSDSKKNLITAISKTIERMEPTHEGVLFIYSLLTSMRRAFKSIDDQSLNSYSCKYLMIAPKNKQHFDIGILSNISNEDNIKIKFKFFEYIIFNCNSWETKVYYDSSNNLCKVSKFLMTSQEQYQINMKKYNEFITNLIGESARSIFKNNGYESRILFESNNT